MTPTLTLQELFESKNLDLTGRMALMKLAKEASIQYQRFDDACLFRDAEKRLRDLLQDGGRDLWPKLRQAEEKR